MDTLTDTLEALDFTITIPCEHSGHELNKEWHAGDAWAVVEYRCNKCPTNARLAVCRKFWYLSMHGLHIHCPDCNHTSPGSQVYTLITLV